MLAKTHILFVLFIVLAFFSKVENFFIFLIVALFSSILPDIDTPFSKIGKFKLSRILNFFTKHRGIIHSLIFMMFLSILFLFFVNDIWLAFTLGYFSHLVLDSFTIQGVRLFYPFKLKVKGFVRTNGLIETFLFILLIFVNFFLVLRLIFLI